MPSFTLVNDPVMDSIRSEPFLGTHLRRNGWVYRDMVGTMSAEEWAAFVAAVGDENIKVLASSIRAGRMRGQFMLSPMGLENAAAYMRGN